MHLAASIATLLVLGTSAPVLAVEATAEGFAAAMHGCWNRADANDDMSSQMCLDGGLAGALTMIECQNHGDLTECSQTEGRYEFRDEKFWRSYGEGSALTGGLDNCDVRFGPGETFELHNCQWTMVPESGLTTEDAVYEKAIGQ